MSKTKLAFLVFTLAVGISIIAFVVSKKAHVIEDVKNVWLYELPTSASPFDSYIAVDLGPQNGLIGTLGHMSEKWDWDGKTKTLTIQLAGGVLFSDHTEFSPTYWLSTRDWVRGRTSSWPKDLYWDAYVKASIFWKSPRVVYFHWDSLPAAFDPEYFMKHTLSNPLTGIIHPKNLADLRLGKKIAIDWISSGPYRVSKWNPKEIVLISRDDYPLTISKKFSRTLKYQSSPLHDSSFDFMQAPGGEGKTEQTLHLFWVCRSWKDPKSFCSITENRENFVKLMTGKATPNPKTLSGQKLRYQIPTGSDAFRNEITQKIKSLVQSAGGSAEEDSDADLELLMVVSDVQTSDEIAAKMAMLTSRLEVNPSDAPSNLVGEFSRYPLQILMKNMKGDLFSKVFLGIDPEEKKLPL